VAFQWIGVGASSIIEGASEVGFESGEANSTRKGKVYED